MRYLIVILCTLIMWFTSNAQNTTSGSGKTTKNTITSNKIKSKSSYPSAKTTSFSTQDIIYKYITNHLFYLGTSESDYDIESRVYFNEDHNIIKQGLKTGTLQIYVDGSSRSMTGNFEVDKRGSIFLHHVVTHDPNAKGTPSMTGTVIKLSDTLYELTLKAPDTAEKTFYLFTL